MDNGNNDEDENKDEEEDDEFWAEFDNDMEINEAQDVS